MDNELKAIKNVVGERGSSKTDMMGHILDRIGQKEKIKDIIKSRFNEKYIILSSEELEREYNIVLKHIKIKCSHHMYSKYRLEDIIEIKKYLMLNEN